jgi:ATP-dependent Clp protease ATP-binding subunit ClpB
VADGNPQVDPLHLLAALIEQQGGTATPLLQAVDAGPAAIGKEAETRIAKLPRMGGATASGPELSRQMLNVINTAASRAREMEDEYVSTEHLLVGLATDGGQAATLLRAAGATPNTLTAAFTQVRGGARVTSGDRPGTYQALERYGIDLTRRARIGEIGQVIGRDAEVRRVILALTRLTKNNPVLIGEPGVGKTAVVEGLARRIADDDVPESVRGKRLTALDLGAMGAGAKDRGEFEERLRGVLSEIRQSNGQVITFINELHIVVDADEATPEAGGMLKPMLATGELRLIGATTPDEFREWIHRDPTLERHLQLVPVNELSVEDSIAVLRGVKGRYEAHHQVQISDAALVAAATLSARYITGRFLPDKAIDLIDEAASRLRMEIDSSPVEIDQLRRLVDRMKTEELALSRESDPTSKKQRERLRTELADRQEQLAALTIRWEREKTGLNRVGELKKRLDDLKSQAERAQRDGDYETASRLLYGDIPTLDAEIAEAVAYNPGDEDGGSAGFGSGPPLVKEEVGPDDITDVVSAWIGIPASRMTGERTVISGHAFMSYIREDSAEADRLQQALEAAGVHVWRDTTDLWPGEDWREKIRQAIIKDSLVFLACFSRRSVSRNTSYQNEELNLAIEQMRIRRPDQPWLIPIRFDDCEIPDLHLGGGRTLGSIHRADLFGNHINDATARLVTAIYRVLKSQK